MPVYGNYFNIKYLLFQSKTGFKILRGYSCYFFIGDTFEPCQKICCFLDIDRLIPFYFSPIWDWRQKRRIGFDQKFIKSDFAGSLSYGVGPGKS